MRGISLVRVSCSPRPPTNRPDLFIVASNSASQVISPLCQDGIVHTLFGCKFSLYQVIKGFPVHVLGFRINLIIIHITYQAYC